MAKRNGPEVGVLGGSEAPMLSAGAAVIERLRDEIACLRRERDAYLAAIIRPWTRDGDGRMMYKINLAWLDSAYHYEDALAMVNRIAAAAGRVPTSHPLQEES